MGEREREEGGVGCVGPSQAIEVFVCESVSVFFLCVVSVSVSVSV